MIGAGCPLLCWFLDAGNERRSAGSTDRRPKSAKARSRGRLGGGDAASYGIWLAGLIRSQATNFSDAVCLVGHSGLDLLTLSFSHFDPRRTSSSFKQHGGEGITGRAIVLRRRSAHLGRPINCMSGRPNCRFGDSRLAWGKKCNAADREHCEGEKSSSRFVNGHFDFSIRMT